jgi:hypothetical protein
MSMSRLGIAQTSLTTWAITIQQPDGSYLPSGDTYPSHFAALDEIGRRERASIAAEVTRRIAGGRAGASTATEIVSSPE